MAQTPTKFRILAARRCPHTTNELLWNLSRKESTEEIRVWGVRELLHGLNQNPFLELLRRILRTVFQHQLMHFLQVLLVVHLTVSNGGNGETGRRLYPRGKHHLSSAIPEMLLSLLQHGEEGTPTVTHVGIDWLSTFNDAEQGLLTSVELWFRPSGNQADGDYESD